MIEANSRPNSCSAGIIGTMELHIRAAMALVVAQLAGEAFNEGALAGSEV